MSDPIKIGLEPYGLKDHALIITGVADERAGLVYSAAQRALEQLSSSLERHLRSSFESRRLIIEECEKRLRIFDPSARVEVQQVRLSDEEEESAAYFSSALELSRRAREIEQELREALPQRASPDPAQQQRDWMAAAQQVLAQKYHLLSPQRETEVALLVDVFRQSAPVALPSSSPLWGMPSLLPAPFIRRAYTLKLTDASDEQLRHAILAPSVVWAARQVAAGSDPSQQDLQRIQTALLCSRNDALKLIALVLHAREQEISQLVGRRPGSGNKIRLFVEDLERPERVDAGMKRLGALLDADRDKIKDALEAIGDSFGEMKAGSNFLTLRLRELERHVQNLVSDWSSLPKELLAVQPAMDAVHLVHELADRMAASEDDLKKLNEVTKKLENLEQSLALSPENASLFEVRNAIRAAKALPGGPALQRALSRTHEHLTTAQASMQALAPDQDERALWLKIVLAIFSLGLASLISWAIRYVPYRREKARLEALVRSDLDQMQRLTGRLRSATRDWAAAISGHNRKTIEKAARTLAEIFEEIRPLTLEVAGDQNVLSPARLKAVLQATAIANGADPSHDLEGAAALVEHCLQTRGPEDLDAACDRAEFAAAALFEQGVPENRSQLEDFFASIRQAASTIAEDDAFGSKATQHPEEAVLRVIAEKEWETQLALIEAQPTSTWVQRLPLATALEAVGPEGRDFLLGFLRGEVLDWNQIPSSVRQGLLRVGLGEVAPSLLTWEKRKSFFDGIRRHLNGLDPNQNGFEWIDRSQEDLWNALQVFERSSITQLLADYKDASRKAYDQTRPPENGLTVSQALETEVCKQFNPVKMSMATLLQSLEENGNSAQVEGLYGAVSVDKPEQMLKDWNRGGYLRQDAQLLKGVLPAASAAAGDSSAAPSSAEHAAFRDSNGVEQSLFDALKPALSGPGDDLAKAKNRFAQLQTIFHQGSLNWTRVFQKVLPMADGWLGAHVDPEGQSVEYLVESKGPGEGVSLKFRLALTCLDEHGELPCQLAVTASLDLSLDDLDGRNLVDRPFVLTVTRLPPPTAAKMPVTRELIETKTADLDNFSPHPAPHWDNTYSSLFQATEARLQDVIFAPDPLDSLSASADITSSSRLEEIRSTLKGQSPDALLGFFAQGGIALFKPKNHLRESTLPENTLDSIRLARARWYDSIAPELLETALTAPELSSSDRLEELFPPKFDPSKSESVHKWLVAFYTLEALQDAAESQNPPQLQACIPLLVSKFNTELQQLSGPKLKSFLDHLGAPYLAQRIPLPQSVLKSPFYAAAQAYQPLATRDDFKALMDSLPHPTQEGRLQLDGLRKQYPERAAAFDGLIEFAPLQLDIPDEVLFDADDRPEAEKLN